ncbi:hypothetical protein PINS_up013924 [Pythium insidiosum]|nr:hypothetical protein PINS_up013924 [Pythium insidiosum]
MTTLLRLSMALGILGALLSGIALYLDDQLIAAGLDKELVAPDVAFERLSIGDTHACVTLRRFSSTLGRWRSQETCYTMFPQKAIPATTIRDLETGVELVLGSICEEDREWLASKLGIPARLGIQTLWQKQCEGWRVASRVTRVLTLVASVVMVLSLDEDIGAAALRDAPHSLLFPVWSHALPAVFGCASWFIWQFRLGSTSLQAGWALSFMRWGVVSLVAMFIVRLMAARAVRIVKRPIADSSGSAAVFPPESRHVGRDEAHEEAGRVVITSSHPKHS